MSISAIGGSPQTTLQERIQAFKQGEGTLQKADLADLKNGVEAVAPKAGTPIQAILDAFDRIDQNKDGISAQELAEFAGANAPPSRPGRAGGPPPRGVGGGGVNGGMGGLPVMVVMMPQGGAPSAASAGGAQGNGDPKAVSKEDLMNLKNLLEKAGLKVPEELQNLIDSFDKLDADQSGTLSLSEVRESMKDKPAPAVPPVEAAAGGSGATRSGGSLASQIKNLLSRVGQALAGAMEAGAGSAADGFRVAPAAEGTEATGAAGTAGATGFQGSVHFSVRASVAESQGQALRAYGQTTAVSYAASASVSMVNMKV